MEKSRRELQDLLDNDSFVRWIKGKATKAEKAFWKKWLKSDPSHPELKRLAKILFRLSFKNEDSSDVDRQLEKLNRQIDQRLSSHLYRFPEPVQSQKSGYLKWAIAAGIVLTIAVTGVFKYWKGLNAPEKKPAYKMIATDFGRQGSIKLSDGSEIRLNAHSTLRYNPSAFTKSDMEVWLRGEAFFSIVHNPEGHKRDFVVHTADGDVMVLGTRFNVNTRYKETQVALIKGSVRIQVRDTVQQKKIEKIIQPGEMAVFSGAQNKVHIQRVDTTRYTAWLNQKLIFDNTPLNDILRDIEQTYGVEVDVREQDLLQQRISGSLVNTNLETLMNGLSKTLDIKVVQRDEKHLVISRN